MDSVKQGERSGGPSSQPTQKKRGRPPKDPSLKHSQSHVPPNSGGEKEHTVQKPNTTVGADQYMTGQTVTGVVEAVLGDIYVLRVKIGHSNIDLRGFALKPGHAALITPENDIAPNVPMIAGNFAPFTFQDLSDGSHGPGSTKQTGGQGSAKQIDPAALRPKRKYSSRKASPSVPPPVAPAPPAEFQHVLFSSEFQTSLNPEDEVVHMVEPLSMIPPPGQYTGVGPVIAAAPAHPRGQVAPGNYEQDVDGSMSKGTPDRKLKAAVTSTDVETPGGDSQVSEDGKEAVKSSSDGWFIVRRQSAGNANEQFSMEPLFNFGSGPMTELLQTVQGNVKVSEVQTAEKLSCAAGVERHEMTAEEIDRNDEEMTVKTDEMGKKTTMDTDQKEKEKEGAESKDA